MDNNKKTFSELFSNIESNSDENKISFNTISEEIKNSEESDVIKSKDIFNQVLKKDNDIKESFNDILSKKNNDSNVNIENNEETKEDNKEIENIFIQDEENKPEEQTEIKEDNKEIENIFIQDEENKSEEQTETNEDNKEIENIFIQDEENKPEEQTEIKEDNKEIENIFIQDEENKPEEQTETNEDNKEIENIFIQNEENKPEEQTETKEDNKEIENIFIQDEENKSEEQTETNEDNKEIENIFIQNEENKSEEQVEKTKNIEETLDQNPFFIENNEQKEEMNPFLDSKINLIENSSHTKIEESSKIDTSNSKHFNVKIVNKKEPLIKFIIGIISYAIFIWLLLIGIALLIYVADIKIRAAKGDYSTPTYNAYVVLTGSMLPKIQVYDVVVTKKTEPKDLKEGDIITFASSDNRFLNTIITHRIIKKYYDAEKKEYTFQSKGDNNNVADSALVQSNKIYGKVILKIPKLGYLQEFLASKGGWIIAILLPCLAVISYDVVKLVKGLKRKKYKNIKVQK